MIFTTEFLLEELKRKVKLFQQKSGDSYNLDYYPLSERKKGYNLRLSTYNGFFTHVFNRYKVEENSAQPKVEKRSLVDSEAIEIVEWWGNLPGTVKHRKSSKSYKSAILSLKKLRQGTFSDRAKSVIEFCEREGFSKKLMAKKWTAQEIKDVLWDISMTGSLNFKVQKNLSLVLFSPRHPTGLVSLFLKVAHKGVDKLKRIEDPNRKVTRLLLKCLADPEPAERDLQRVYEATKEIVDWYYLAKDYGKKSDEKLVKMFCGHIESPKHIAEMYLEWYETRRRGKASINHLGPKGWGWNVFIDWWLASLFGEDTGIIIRPKKENKNDD
jgi:hypothetical protein